jgi:hypothetical protein
MNESSTHPLTHGLLFAVRYILPAVAVAAGIFIMALGSDADLEGGAGIVSAGAAIYAMNWLYRASFADHAEREAEEAARRYLDEHGHWPDEAP